MELEVPEHLQALYMESCTQLRNLDKQRTLAWLLFKYKGVFSEREREHDVVQHEIPVFLGTVPIKQPPHRLGLEKEAQQAGRWKDFCRRG